MALTFVLIKSKNFNSIAVSKILQVATLTILQFSFSKLSVDALIYSYLISQLCTLSFLVHSAKDFLKVSAEKRDPLKSIIIKYKKFPLFSTWEGLINSFSAELIVLLGGLYFNSALIGVYLLVNRFTALPLAMISGALMQSFYVHAAEARVSGSIADVTSDLLIKIIRLTTLPVCIGILLGPPLVPIFFGENYSYGSNLVTIVLIGAFSHLLSATLSPLFSIYNVQNVGLIWNINLLVVRLISLCVGIKLNSFYLMVCLFVGGSAIMYLIALLYFWYLTRFELTKPIRCLSGQLFVALPILVVKAMAIFSLSTQYHLVMVIALLYFLCFWYRELRLVFK